MQLNLAEMLVRSVPVEVSCTCIAENKAKPEGDSSYFESFVVMLEGVVDNAKRANTNKP